MSQNSDIIDVEFDEVPSEERIKEELNHPNFRTWFKGLLKDKGWRGLLLHCASKQVISRARSGALSN